MCVCVDGISMGFIGIGISITVCIGIGIVICISIGISIGIGIGISIRVLIHLSKGQLSKDTFVHGGRGPSDSCPRRLAAKEIFGQG